MRAMIITTLFSAMGFGLSGCGDVGVAVDTSAGSGGAGGLTDGVAQGTAPYLVLTLATGSRETRADLADLATNPAYRTTTMIFRRLKEGGRDHWLAVFELTQAQWQFLAGTTPWMSAPTAVVGTAASGDALPAFNLAYDEITSAVIAYRNAHQVTLSVPSASTWRTACAAGTTTTWSWGEAHDRATLANYAVVWETLSGTRGPRAVGERQPNPFGFYDLHGNIGEWIAPGTTVAGGSWHDPAILARTVFTTTPLAADIEHALIGVRLEVQP